MIRFCEIGQSLDNMKLADAFANRQDANRLMASHCVDAFHGFLEAGLSPLDACITMTHIVDAVFKEEAKPKE